MSEPRCRYCGNTNPEELCMDLTVGQEPLIMCRTFDCGDTQ